MQDAGVTAVSELLQDAIQSLCDALQATKVDCTLHAGAGRVDVSVVATSSQASTPGWTVVPGASATHMESIIVNGEVAGQLRITRPGERKDLDAGERAAVAATCGRIARDLGHREAGGPMPNGNIDDVLSLVAHELRGPLSVLVSTSSTLLQHPSLPAPEREALVASVHRQALRLQALANDALHAGSIRAGQSVPQIEAVALLSLVEQLKADPGCKGCDGLRVLEGSEATLLGDPALLLRVLTNVVANAIRYGGDHVRLGVEPGRDGYLRVLIQDNGGPIPTQEAETLFTPWVRGPSRAGRGVGSGLGLSLTRDLVECQDGVIWHETREGVWTTFVVELKLA